ncbi:hypothetical protein EDD11_003934 [Mortierella claussenii]|nr:hypothetical protein EDD11_003934 [Mortierella claussenii]
MERAKHAECQVFAEKLLNVVGGGLGRRIEDNKDKNPILIGVGRGQFCSNSKLSSLHSTFLSYFIGTARAPATACNRWDAPLDGESRHEFEQHGSKQ